MSRFEKHAELERLRRMLHSAEAAVADWRERLIESLGDRMCGSGQGPAPEDLATLAALQAEEQRARDVHALCLIWAAAPSDVRSAVEPTPSGTLHGHIRFRIR
ncbi:hypothetical protein SRS16CHR_01014 [Variovorax sp. SRS16]|uniref:hypothetical protein n=1 Tax=Variovorax sp. SRS16 TaxID=282217 RepID=UPI0013162720|nr:hypothetical protein [Variovorax sp. SRS16]VTU14281.1 hypothetical protein SRS16CHR_01014 [Variovorax sp. SRS16]